MLSIASGSSDFLESGESVLDVGTGGGVPGVVLAILRPDLEVPHLCDFGGQKGQGGRGGDCRRNRFENSGASCRGARRGRARAVRHTGGKGRAPLAKLLTWFAPRWDFFDRLVVLKGSGVGGAERAAAPANADCSRGLRISKLATYPLLRALNQESCRRALQIRRQE